MTEFVAGWVSGALSLLLGMLFLAWKCEAWPWGRFGFEAGYCWCGEELVKGVCPSESLK